MRVAAIDVGTNSVRLLVSDGATELHREMRIVRLGQDVDRTGVLAPAAVERTRAALAEYAEVIAASDVARTRLVATSATRDARNRTDFVAMVRATLGVEPEVITGDDEAALSFAGAVASLGGLAAPVLLIDLGGGSTELVMGDPAAAGGLRARSMDIGSVRMTERHLSDDPPTGEQVAAVVAEVRSALARAHHDVPFHDAATLVGVAGTVTTVAAIALGLQRYESDVIHGSRLAAAQISEITDQLCHADHQARQAIAAIHPGRIDVITAGAIILRTVVETVGVPELVVSEHDILDGIALSIADADAGNG